MEAERIAGLQVVQQEVAEEAVAEETTLVKVEDLL